MSIRIYRAGPISRPTTTPLASTVADHANGGQGIPTNSDFGLRNNSGLWPSYNMLQAAHETPACPDPETELVFEFPVWIPGFEFSVHGGVQCNAIGFDEADAKAELARVFKANEGHNIEKALLDTRFQAYAGSGTANDPVNAEDGWDGPTVLSNGAPTGLLSVYAALALLEGYAASVYAGVPTLHIPRGAANLLNERIVWRPDGKAYTRSGAKVAIGGGYDGEDVSGTWDMYATGEVFVEASELIEIGPLPVLPGEGPVGSDMPSKNEPLTDSTILLMNERMYRVAVDGFVAKCTAKVW